MRGNVFENLTLCLGVSHKEGTAVLELVGDTAEIWVSMLVCDTGDTIVDWDPGDNRVDGELVDSSGTVWETVGTLGGGTG